MAAKADFWQIAKWLFLRERGRKILASAEVQKFSARFLQAALSHGGKWALTRFAVLALNVALHS